MDAFCDEETMSLFTDSAVKNFKVLVVKKAVAGALIQALKVEPLAVNELIVSSSPNASMNTLGDCVPVPRS